MHLLYGTMLFIDCVATQGAIVLEPFLNDATHMLHEQRRNRTGLPYLLFFAHQWHQMTLAFLNKKVGGETELG